MSMYTIVKNLKGGFSVSCTIQDGVETYQCKTEDEAVKKLIRAAKVMNGTKITRKDIDFGEEHHVLETRVAWHPKPACGECGREL